MKKQTLTKKQQEALLEIAKRLMASVDSRGDLEERGCDSEDFIEVPVWGIQKAAQKQASKNYPSQTAQAPRRGCVAAWGKDGGMKNMEEIMMDIIVEIYNHMDEGDKEAFTLEDAKEMVEDQIRMDKEAGREPLDYDPHFFYDNIRDLMEQDAEDED